MSVWSGITSGFFTADMEKNELQVEIPSVLKQSSWQNIRGFDCIDYENGNDLNHLGNASSVKVRN